MLGFKNRLNLDVLFLAVSFRNFGSMTAISVNYPALKDGASCLQFR